MGGIGVIVLAAAVVSTSENESFTEIHGNKAPTETIRSTTIGTAAAIWWMLAYFTVIAVLLLWLAGMPLWEAINHAMTGLTTGGFSIVPDSMGYYGPRIQAALIPVMMLGATSFSVLFFALQGDGEHLVRDAQTKWLVGGVRHRCRRRRRRRGRHRYLSDYPESHQVRGFPAGLRAVDDGLSDRLEPR